MPLKNKSLTIFLLLILSVFIISLAPFFFSTKISLKELYSDKTINYIFFNLRIPRVLTGFFAGIIFSLSGLIFQTLFRNPLVSPFTLGISSGASSGIFIALKLGITGIFLSVFSLSQLFAIVFSILTIYIVYFIARKRGEIELKTALLAGISLNFLFSSLILILHFLSTPEESFEYFKWIFGSVETSGYNSVIFFMILSLLLILLSLFFSKEFDLFSLSEEIAVSKGVNVKQLKTIFFFFTSIIIAFTVSFTGPIAFVGLIVPHMAKSFGGKTHKELIIYSSLLGGIIIVLSDALSRVTVAPAEIPIGIITTLFGVPFMIYLIYRKN